jgi:hypothetical protein
MAHLATWTNVLADHIPSWQSGGSAILQKRPAYQLEIKARICAMMRELLTAREKAATLWRRS